MLEYSAAISIEDSWIIKVDIQFRTVKFTVEILEFLCVDFDEGVFNMVGVKISGIGSARPETILTNDGLAKIVETSDEWITTRTGIKSRYISNGISTTDLAVEAAKKAMAEANISAKDIDMIIVATLTPDLFMPSAACMVQIELGAINATAFDIGAACSGFVYASKIATNAIRCGTEKIVLVIGAEVLSKVVDWKDRNTCVLFGDGAGAVVYEATDVNKVLSIYTQSAGNINALSLDGFPVKNCFTEAAEPKTESYIKMDGREVYKFAIAVVPLCIEKVLENTEFTVADVDHFILHQANERILDTAAKKINIDKSKFFKNLDKYGNTSAASIPIALDEAKANFKAGDKIIMVGFGGGLTWGSILFEW